jgi:hypothetical protein
VFETSYAFTKVTSVPGSFLNPQLVQKSIYRFDSRSNRRYIVEVHEHPKKVFVVKFYLRDHKNYTSKYNVLTAFNEWGGVLRTVIDICIHFREKHSDASFAFIGVPTLLELQEQDEKEITLPNNKRFRVYKKLTETFMGTQTFKHVRSEDTNSYLLINKVNQNHTEEIIQMLASIYEDLGDILRT